MYAVISCSSLVPSGLELSWLVVASVQATALNGKLISNTHHALYLYTFNLLWKPKLEVSNFTWENDLLKDDR